LEYKDSYVEDLREKYSLVKSEWSASHAWSLDKSPTNSPLRVLDRGLHSGEKSHPVPCTIGESLAAILRKDFSEPASGAGEAPRILRGSMESGASGQRRAGHPLIRVQLKGETPAM